MNAPTAYPLISIVIPVFNGANFLREAVESALAQDYSAFEVVVVNDGSTDGGATRAIAQGYGDRIRYLEKPNGGVGSALNAGIGAMRGEYFSWLSHDDLYVPHKLSTQARVLRALANPRAVLYSDFLHVDERGAPLFDVCLDHALLQSKPLYSLMLAKLNGCTMLIPRQAFEEVGLFKPLPTTQDYEMWSRLIRRYDFVHVPEILLRSRLHANQGSRSRAADAEADALWISLMDGLSHEELLSLEARPEFFFHAMAQWLEKTPYVGALAFARERTAGLTLAERLRLWNLRSAARRAARRLGLLPLALRMDRAFKSLRRTARSGEGAAG